MSTKLNKISTVPKIATNSKSGESARNNSANKISDKSSDVVKTNISEDKLITGTKPKKKKKINHNVYNLIQFKKMIGKGMIKPWTGAVIDKEKLAENMKKIKDLVLSRNIKTINMMGYVNNGIIYVFRNVDRLYLLNSISYQDLKNTDVDLEINIIQYSDKLTKSEINKLIADG